MSLFARSPASQRNLAPTYLAYTGLPLAYKNAWSTVLARLLGTKATQATVVEGGEVVDLLLQTGGHFFVSTTLFIQVGKAMADQDRTENPSFYQRLLSDVQSDSKKLAQAYPNLSQADIQNQLRQVGPALQRVADTLKQTGEALDKWSNNNPPRQSSPSSYVFPDVSNLAQPFSSSSVKAPGANGLSTGDTSTQAEAVRKLLQSVDKLSTPFGNMGVTADQIANSNPEAYQFTVQFQSLAGKPVVFSKLSRDFATFHQQLTKAIESAQQANWQYKGMENDSLATQLIKLLKLPVKLQQTAPSAVDREMPAPQPINDPGVERKLTERFDNLTINGQPLSDDLKRLADRCHVNGISKAQLMDIIDQLQNADITINEILLHYCNNPVSGSMGGGFLPPTRRTTVGAATPAPAPGLGGVDANLAAKREQLINTLRRHVAMLSVPFNSLSRSLAPKLGSAGLSDNLANLLNVSIPQGVYPALQAQLSELVPRLSALEETKKGILADRDTAQALRTDLYQTLTNYSTYLNSPDNVEMTFLTALSAKVTALKNITQSLQTKLGTMRSNVSHIVDTLRQIFALATGRPYTLLTSQQMGALNQLSSYYAGGYDISLYETEQLLVQVRNTLSSMDESINRAKPSQSNRPN